MKIFINNWPDDETFQPDESELWTPMKESTNLWIVQLKSIPFLLMNVIMLYILFFLLDINIDINYGLFFAVFLVLIPIHEVIHALFFPESIFSDNVKFGLFPKQLVFFAFYTKEMSRNRFACVLGAPFLLITVAGLLLILFLGDNRFITHFLLINAYVSCADTMNVFKVLIQVPSSAIVRNKEIRTYWRKG